MYLSEHKIQSYVYRGSLMSPNNSHSKIWDKDVSIATTFNTLKVPANKIK